jgi:dTDP-glucose 4,6-dehydratase/UDP-glucose 4-epimerase
MNILIIGSKGFIGSNCIRYFRSEGYDVIGCDIYDLKEENYVCLSSTDLKDLFTRKKFDFCINAAGSAHVAYSFQFPEKDFELNVSLVINLLGAIKNYCPQCKFINFSSAAVYGNPSALPIAEDAPVNPLSPYGYHKSLSENLLLEYNRFFDLKTCSLRVFSAYGEGLKKQLFWDLYKKVENKDSITLYGTGNESRDFIYILDLVSIVHLIMKKSNFAGEIYNIGNGEEILIKDAVAAFYRELGWNGITTFSGEEKIGDPVNWKADIKKITALGYIRKYSFSSGLRNYCEWLKDLE